MKTAIILHGMPSKEEYFNPDKEAQSNKHWLPWIQRQLILDGVLAQAIELPEPYEPVYEKWAKVFEQFDINEDTILIGHSCGAGFLVRWLSENKIKVNKVVLVAPYLGLDGGVKLDFFDFEIDPKISERTNGLTIFVSNDDKDILESMDKLKNELENINVIELKNKGHFTLGCMGTKEFPELRDFLL
jgi:uncharacterized protein